MSECDHCGREIPERRGLVNYCGEYCKTKDLDGLRTYKSTTTTN